MGATGRQQHDNMERWEAGGGTCLRPGGGAGTASEEKRVRSVCGRPQCGSVSVAHPPCSPGWRTRCEARGSRSDLGAACAYKVFRRLGGERSLRALRKGFCLRRSFTSPATRSPTAFPRARVPPPPAPSLAFARLCFLLRSGASRPRASNATGTTRAAICLVASCS